MSEELKIDDYDNIPTPERAMAHVQEWRRDALPGVWQRCCRSLADALTAAKVEIAKAKTAEGDCRAMYKTLKDLQAIVRSASRNISIEQIVAVCAPLREGPAIDPLIKAEAERDALKAQIGIMRAALLRAQYGISEAIHDEYGLDGAEGQEILREIEAALKSDERKEK